MDALFQQAFRDHPVPYCMFDDRPSEERETMRDALVEVAGFQSFERQLADSGVQWQRLDAPELRARALDALRERFAAYPHMAALDAPHAEWFYE